MPLDAGRQSRFNREINFPISAIGATTTSRSFRLAAWANCRENISKADGRRQGPYEQPPQKPFVWILRSRPPMPNLSEKTI